MYFLRLVVVIAVSGLLVACNMGGGGGYGYIEFMLIGGRGAEIEIKWEISLNML